MVMTVTPFPELVVYIGFSLTLFTVLSVASIFVYRRRRAGWRRLRALDFAWPLIPASYILVGTGMMVYGVIWKPLASLTALARWRWARWCTATKWVFPGTGGNGRWHSCFQSETARSTAVAGSSRMRWRDGNPSAHPRTLLGDRLRGHPGRGHLY